MEKKIRLGVWSGPRSLSTALMRSWGNREDTFVIDEPLYSYFCTVTGVNYPCSQLALDNCESDADKVISQLLAPFPEDKRIFYQKHLIKYMVGGISTDWDMINSWLQVVPNCSMQEFGYSAMGEMFKNLTQRTGKRPIVIDAKDLLDDPRTVSQDQPMLHLYISAYTVIIKATYITKFLKILSKWCEKLQVPFCEKMLSWAPGVRDTDGIASKFWYESVSKSTGFGIYKESKQPVPDYLQPVLKDCNAVYRSVSRTVHLSAALKYLLV